MEGVQAGGKAVRHQVILEPKAPSYGGHLGLSSLIWSDEHK